MRLFGFVVLLTGRGVGAMMSYGQFQPELLCRPVLTGTTSPSVDGDGLVSRPVTQLAVLTSLLRHSNKSSSHLTLTQLLPFETPNFSFGSWLF